MTSRMDIWRSAKLLVDQHGADAPIRAAQRADELLKAGHKCDAVHVDSALPAEGERGRFTRR